MRFRRPSKALSWLKRNSSQVLLFVGEFSVNDSINYCGNHMHIVMQIPIDMLL